MAHSSQLLGFVATGALFLTTAMGCAWKKVFKYEHDDDGLTLDAFMEGLSGPGPSLTASATLLLV